MKRLFADTGYWIALLSPNDALHSYAANIAATLGAVQIVTSEWVLTEFLDSFAERGAYLRQAASDMVSLLLSRPDVLLVSFRDATFQQGLGLYTTRADKNWSLTDCSSFLIMRQLDIAFALSHDRPFEQAGFKALLRDSEE